MKIKLLTAIAVLAMASLVSAQILVPDGDFSSGQGSWISDGPATESYPTIGGNPGGYGVLDATTGWGVFVQDFDLASNGFSGGDTITLTFDMIDLADDTSAAGLKIESWNGTGFLDNGFGDVKWDPTTSWLNYGFHYTINPAATFLKFVPLSVDGGITGFDNVGVVPEPATLGLLGLVAGGLYFTRRIFMI